YRCARFAVPPVQAIGADALADALADDNRRLLRHPWTRMAWTAHADRTVLFAAGESCACPRDLAERLCRETALRFDTPPADAELHVLLWLVNRGHLSLEP